MNGFTAGAAYSNDSSHIILGRSLNRRLAGLDLTYSRRIGRKAGIAYTWDIEARPLVFLRDPVASTTTTFNIPGVSLPPFTDAEVPLVRNCADSTITGTITFPTAPGTLTTGTYTSVRTCGSRWTYAGGVSPLGQRLNLFPRHRFQPFLTANGGFLMATRDVPAQDSSWFNFTFDFGAGVTWFRENRSAWSIDYRVQHMSNKNLGDQNPGVDSQVFRVSYTVPRLALRRVR